jgi:DNA-directed RNA polymerase subunit RPC12/RpoP
MTPTRRLPGGYEQKTEDWPPDRVADRDEQYDCPRCGPDASTLCYRCTTCQRDLAEATK